MNVQIFTKNEIGIDYIVGDIHGCFIELQAELDLIGFDKTKDRLFSVGDLVDRGPNSIDAIEWLKKDWFHAVRGNHEQMALDFRTYGGMDRNTYAYNGGKWFIDLDEGRKAEVKFAFGKLPFMIELETDIGKVGIIHAEVPTDDWEEAKKAFNEVDQTNTRTLALQNVVMWNRDRIRNNYTVPVKNIDYVVVGHTPLKQMQILGNVIYIDTGAVFKGRGHFTILRANDLFHVNHVP